MVNNLKKIKLSPYAKMFYVEWLLDPDSVRYNIIFINEIVGNLDIQKLKASISCYVKNNLLMHCHIENSDEGCCWVENSEINDLEYAESYSDVELLSYINKPFDLHKNQPCRFILFQRDNERYVFVVVLHHLVIDALSVKEGVFKEISNYYNDKNYTSYYTIEQQKEKLINLADYYHNRVEANREKYQLFWQEQLRNIEYIDLSFLKIEHKPYQKTHLNRYSNTQQIKFNFDATVVNKLHKLKRKYLITPYHFGLCLFAILLHRYTSQTKFAIAYPIAIKKGTHPIYGAQVNTTLMPYEFNSDSTFLKIYNKNKEFLKLVKNGTLNYTEFPNIELFNDNNKKLTSVLFVQTVFRSKQYNLPDLIQKSRLDEFNIYLNDIFMFEQEELEQILYYQVQFDIVKMDEELVQDFIASFKRLFVQVIDELESGLIDKPLSSYSLLTADRYQHLVYGLNNNQYPIVKKTIHDLFIEQVNRTPDNIAVTFEGVTLTYAKLNQQANQLAAYIERVYQPQCEDLVILHMGRSHYILISILALFKIGCAYIPVSTEITDLALLHILADSKSKLIITNECYQAKINRCFRKYTDELKTTPDLLAVDAQAVQALLYQQQQFTAKRQAGNNLAYVLYTSGSTGQPKGVMMEHLASVNKVLEMVRFSQITQQDVILFKTNYIFDVSFTDIFCGLIVGAKLIITKEVFNTGEILAQLESNLITICHFTPSQFEVIKSIKGPQLFNSLRVIHFSGEALDPKLLNDIDEKIHCINYYGPTETGEVSAELTKSSSSSCITIGYPLANIQFYIVDENLNPVPTGVVGELYIGGVALARGYLNQPALTAERFIPNPFQTSTEKYNNQNSRLYKTGDLVRRLLSGNIEYRGRNDYQIKIRGHRIELGEIENKLKGLSGIKQAVVLAITKNQEQQLIAYYVSELAIEPSIIRGYLLERLPEYMLPNQFVHVDTFTLTANGKLDLKQLSLIEPVKEQSTYIAPRNRIEEKICCSFAEILNLSKFKISIDDDFFQLGGNSISAIKLLLKLDCLNIRTADIFKFRTAKKIAENVPLAKNSLKQGADNIINFYLSYNYVLKESTQSNIVDDSTDESNHDTNIHKKIALENVLLTGSTGHLGCNILAKLLTDTPYKIYLLIRAESSKEALDRITHKFNYYFKRDLADYSDRVVILNGDLEHPKFKLNESHYTLLTDRIDSVIHCASLVKHYGEYDDFYQANVQSTLNLLEFARNMRGKEFNYISTIGVLMGGYIPGVKSTCIGEDDSLEQFKVSNNFYLQTKYRAEQLIIKYRTYGINGTILRVGNLGMHSTSYQIQENIEENLFFAHLQAMFALGVIPDEMAKMELSPVDCTADAIIKIFDKSLLINQTYHIFNPKFCDLIKVFSCYPALRFKKCTLTEFVNLVLKAITDSDDKFYLFMLYQLWHQECRGTYYTKVQILQEKTEEVLAKLRFAWPVITSVMVKEFVKHAIPA